MNRYTESDFEGLAMLMVDGTALRLTFDAGQQLNTAIIALFDRKICVLSEKDRKNIGAAVSGVMSLSVDIVFIPDENFDVGRFSVIMAELCASIIEVEFIDKDKAPTPARMDAFSTPSGASRHVFM